MRRLIYAAIIIILTALVLMFRTSPDFAIGAAVTPGPLSAAHADYENDCSECHSSLNKRMQKYLCLGCHDEVREDVESNHGFHGRSRSVLKKPCKYCHTEHVGRDGAIVSLNERTFDHNFTDFPLTGTHGDVSVTCEACHEKGKKYRQAPTECLCCHSDKDDHDGQLGNDCLGCHKETSWDDTHFDHDATCFPLEGRHRDAACESCHHDKAYLSTSTKCNACHIMSDIHDGELDDGCDRCHGAEDWNEVEFEHSLETEFVLEDRHSEVKCIACHTDLTFLKKPGTECADCHQPSDIHKGKVGLNCQDCHSLPKWEEVAFDHNCDTEFELIGRHKELHCVACHKQSIEEEKPSAECNNCHEADDVHKEQLGTECDSCHNTDAWNEKIAFDHDMTLFPLIGLHATTACGECHLSSVYKGTDAACTSCHEEDDYHKGTLGSECESCHNPNDWRLWQFDHALRADFKLQGAHVKLECNACHTSRVGDKIELPRTCAECHANDDIHYRRFGKQCDRCHTTESFGEIKRMGD